MNDSGIEQKIKDKGLNAPRVTPADIQASIGSEHYFTAEQGDRMAQVDESFSEDGVFDVEVARSIPAPLRLMTFCVLVLTNGFTVHGVSACASPENFDAELGRQIARRKAIDQIWPLLGFRLRDAIHTGQRTEAVLGKDQGGND